MSITKKAAHIECGRPLYDLLNRLLHSENLLGNLIVRIDGDELVGKLLSLSLVFLHDEEVSDVVTISLHQTGLYSHRRGQIWVIAAVIPKYLSQ